jgi:hypothetical protein
MDTADNLEYTYGGKTEQEVSWALAGHFQGYQLPDERTPAELHE